MESSVSFNTLSPTSLRLPPGPRPSRLVAVWRFHCIKKEGSFPPLWLPRSRPSRPLAAAGRGRVVGRGEPSWGGERWSERPRSSWCAAEFCRVWIVLTGGAAVCPASSPEEGRLVLPLVLLRIPRCWGQWYANGCYWSSILYSFFSSWTPVF